jgi:hypothetical protein
MPNPYYSPVIKVVVFNNWIIATYLMSGINGEWQCNHWHYYYGK